MGIESKQTFATKRDVQEVVGKAVDDLTGVIQAFMMHVDDRFNHLETRVDKLEQDFARLQNTLDAFLKRVDDIETENHFRDAQFNRLMAWAEKVSKKTGIKLEY